MVESIQQMLLFNKKERADHNSNLNHVLLKVEVSLLLLHNEWKGQNVANLNNDQSVLNNLQAAADLHQAVAARVEAVEGKVLVGPEGVKIEKVAYGYLFYFILNLH
jgi:hypothetical protein